MDTQGASRLGGDVATEVATKCLGAFGCPPLKEEDTMARWELVPKGHEFLLLRDGERIVGLGAEQEWAEEQLRWYREQERQAREALATGDPLNLCRLGWHRGGLPAPVAEYVGAPSLYFRFGAKIGEAGGTLVYRVAEGPFEFQARTVKCLRMLDPWSCSVCNLPVDDANRKLM